MRKLSLIVVLMVGITTVWAQKTKVSTASTSLIINDLTGAKSNIDAAMVDEKSKEWPRTWIVAGEVYIKLDKANTDAIGAEKAVGYYDQAIVFDQKGDEKGKGIGKYKKEISVSITQNSVDLVNCGIVAFQAENYVKASLIFEKYIELTENPYLFPVSTPDTAIIYNAALAAYNAKNWDKAIKFFNRSIDLKYNGGDAILLINNIYSEQKDVDNQVVNLKRGFELFPQDDRILSQLINLYLELKKNDEALTYLDAAIKTDPTNPSFYYAKGVLFAQSGNFNEAVSNYNLALEKDPINFNALYNSGVLYYNKGVEMTNIANEIKDLKKYEVARDEANSYFQKALPYMERASAVNPKDIEVLQSLKGLYYRFNQLDKYNETDAKVKALQQ